MSLTCLFAQNATAFAEACTSSKWRFPEGVVGDIKYGMPAKEAKKLLAKKYAGKAKIVLTEDLLLVKFNAKHQTTFDMILLNIVSNQVVSLKFSYSETFQKALGGFESARSAVTKKIGDLVGSSANDFENSPDYMQYTAKWNPNGGSTLQVISIESQSTLFVKYTCEELEETLTRQKAESVNFGF